MSNLLNKVNSISGPLSGMPLDATAVTFLGTSTTVPLACTPITPGITELTDEAVDNCNEISCPPCSESSLCDALTIITT